MRIVGCHEELTPVLRIVIAMRTESSLTDSRGSIAAQAGLEMVATNLAATGPRERDSHLNEVSPADSAHTRIRLGHDRMNRAHPRGIEPDGDQIHLAQRACARLGLDDVRMHRTGHRESRQL